MAQHNFNTETAKLIGILPAVVLQNIEFWCAKNRANEKHFHDGLYWTYNSVQAFSKLFIYASPKQLRTTLDKLIENGYIVAGNYNKLSFDKTKWYAITPEGQYVLLAGQTHLPKRADTFAQEGKAIPYNKPDYKTTDNKHIYKYQLIVDKYNEICLNLPKCTKLTDKRKKQLEKVLKTYSEDEITTTLTKTANSLFLNGKVNEFKCSFDWIFKPDNFIKILEGNYDNKESVNGKISKRNNVADGSVEEKAKNTWADGIKVIIKDE